MATLREPRIRIVDPKNVEVAVLSPEGLTRYLGGLGYDAGFIDTALGELLSGEAVTVARSGGRTLTLRVQR